MSFHFTDEQQAIIAAARDTTANLMIQAYAGCAKTTTLEAIANAIGPDAKGRKIPSLALAFNVKIKKELEKRFPDHFQVLTMNGLGHRAWGSAIGKQCTVDGNKLGGIVTKAMAFRGLGRASDLWVGVRDLVAAAMQAGMVHAKWESQYRTGFVQDRPEVWADLADSNFIDLPEEHLSLAREVLELSIMAAFQGQISYDDQIYMSTLYGGNFPKFSLIMVDEAQDLSPLNHIQVRKCLVPSGGRLIVCGDPKQAIYAFRGADSQSMGKLRGLRPVESWQDLPLTLTFRCPKVVVRRQQSHAPGFTAGPKNADGKFIDLVFEASDRKWTLPKLREMESWGEEQIAILCRNNAPLMKMAFALIRDGIGPVVMGREIGKSLIALSNKIVKDDTTPLEDTIQAIKKWEETEVSLARANDKEEKVAAIYDRSQSLLAVCESAGVTSAGELRSALEKLFARENGQVILATGHKSKGLEWHTVIHLDPWRVPSKFARESLALGNPVPMDQDMNLRYVIETRAKHTLVLANSADYGLGEVQ